MSHTGAYVFHIVRSRSPLRAPNLEVIGLEKEHQVTSRRCAVYGPLVAVFEQNGKHARMIQMGVCDDDSIKLIQRQRFWSVKIRHGVGIRCNVDTNIDHDLRLIGCDQMAGPTNLLIGTQSSDSCPWCTWALRSMDVQSKILEQFAPFFSMHFPVTTNVSNGFGFNWWRSFNLDFPPRFGAYLVGDSSSPTNGFRWVFTLYDYIPVTRIEKEFRDFC